MDALQGEGAFFKRKKPSLIAISKKMRSDSRLKELWYLVGMSCG
jgi:hypothetical protein